MNVTRTSVGGTPGHLTYAVVATTGVTVNSSSGTDASVVEIDIQAS